MKRETWTDERLDDLSRRMDQGFERVDRDIRDLRTEVGGEFRELRTLIHRFGAGLLVAIIASALLQHSF